MHQSRFLRAASATDAQTGRHTDSHRLTARAKRWLESGPIHGQSAGVSHRPFGSEKRLMPLNERGLALSCGSSGRASSWPADRLGSRGRPLDAGRLHPRPADLYERHAGCRLSLAAEDSLWLNVAATRRQFGRAVEEQFALLRENDFSHSISATCRRQCVCQACCCLFILNCHICERPTGPAA